MARHRVRVIKRPGLVEIHADASAGDVDGGQAPLVVKLLDGPHRAVGDIETPVPLAELNPVAHREAPLFQSFDLKGPALFGIDGVGQAAPLHGQAQPVLLLVD